MTGGLDPLASRDEFLDLGRQSSVPNAAGLWGRDTAEVARGNGGLRGAAPAFAACFVPHGKLAVHEEFPDATAEAIAAFLREDARTAAAP